MFLTKLAGKVEPEPASSLLTDTVRPSGVRSVTQKLGFLNRACFCILPESWGPLDFPHGLLLQGGWGAVWSASLPFTPHYQNQADQTVPRRTPLGEDRREATYPCSNPIDWFFG